MLDSAKEKGRLHTVDELRDLPLAMSNSASEFRAPEVEKKSVYLFFLFPFVFVHFLPQTGTRCVSVLFSNKKENMDFFHFFLAQVFSLTAPRC